ncbi:hypothetical protein LguiB_008627 [Lonicera macranthoides]
MALLEYLALEGESISITDSTSCSKWSRISRANMSMSKHPTKNAPASPAFPSRWNSTESFAACVKSVQD